MSVKCADCKQELWPDQGEPPPDAVAGPMEARHACPKCGATARTFEVSATAGGVRRGGRDSGGRFHSEAATDVRVQPPMDRADRARWKVAR
jgi:hypothetical protein